MFREQNIELKRQLEQRKELLEQQRENWNQYSSGWKKWDELIMGAMKPVGDALLDELPIRGNEHVLDVASGTGEPGLSLTLMLPGGEVTGTDLSEKMVAIANENGLSRGLPNYRSQACDAADLPFNDQVYDHVVCRFGIMFFPDIGQGLAEMTRVLKKGGKMAVAVWAAPEKNPFITIMASTIMKKLNLPAPRADKPGIFRCATPGYSRQLLRDAGLNDVTETNLTGHAVFESAPHYWEVMSDVAGPLMQALEKAPPRMVEEIRQNVIEETEKYRENGVIRAGWEAIVVTGVK
jgi:ubiquinone/menaquinone biosynthesis C-methylase UbiE